jgi:hypothetical protein
MYPDQLLWQATRITGVRGTHRDEKRGGRLFGVREYPMGKKEAQQLAARTAAVGTPRERLLERYAALTASDGD